MKIDYEIISNLLIGYNLINRVDDLKEYHSEFKKHIFELNVPDIMKAQYLKLADKIFDGTLEQINRDFEL